MKQILFNILNKQKRHWPMSLLNFAINSKIIRILIILIAFFIFWNLFFLLSLFFFPLPERLENDFSQTYYYRDNSIAWITLNKESQYRTYTRIKNVSSYLKKGIVEYEDKYFYFHPGFNPVSIIRALFLNIKAKSIVSGGSTITMQAARLSEPKKRTFKNKLYELFRAIQLETKYSKKKILELYLNLIPMGGNIEGIGAASFFYFNKSPLELSFAESSLLISLSNSPENNRPDRHPDAARRQREKVAKKIAKRFNINKEELTAILDSSVPTRNNVFSYDIIPLIQRLDKLPYKKERFLSIDKDLQRFCLSNIKEKLNLLDCLNGAIIIIDNKTMDVLTYIGSPFYTRREGSVKFNAANIYRSPGSTLKPFIYARALETGLISQKKKLFDFPEEFYGYKPKNFSNKYDGIISADEALIRSLNIPAVYLLNILGKEGIKEVFKRAGFKDRIDKIADEDISIALGSLPMTLENMVELYGALANKGILNNLNFFKDNKVNISKGNKIITEEADFMITEILSNVFRPDLPTSWEFTKDKPKVAFKTGTSYGFVDAWSLGYTPLYTIGVWVGKLDNKFTKVLTGISSASPILFSIINELERHNDEWFTRPEGVKKRKVCAVSGMAPSKFCDKLVEEYYIPKLSDNSICTVHKKIYIEKITGEITPLEKLDTSKEYEEKIVELWDEKVEYYLKQLGKKTAKEYKGNYDDIYEDKSISILSPLKDVKYVINYNEEVEYQKLPLIAFGFPDSKYFYWYADKKFIGKVETDEPLYYLPTKNYITFSVVDEKGRSGEVSIKFEFIKRISFETPSSLSRN